MNNSVTTTTRLKADSANGKSYVSIGLTNPKSPSNVGAVLRAAGCYGAEQVLYTGKRYEHAAKFNGVKHNTDTKNIGNKIPLKQAGDFENIEVLRAFLANNTKIICVDLVEGAIPLPHFQHPEQAFYIFGPEDGTISQSVVDNADSVVYVPTVGCMNLAASVNVLLYDRLAKKLQNTNNTASDNTLIKQSRDTNNNVKVKSINGK